MKEMTVAHSNPTIQSRDFRMSASFVQIPPPMSGSPMDMQQSQHYANFYGVHDPSVWAVPASGQLMSAYNTSTWEMQKAYATAQWSHISPPSSDQADESYQGPYVAQPLESLVYHEVPSLSVVTQPMIMDPHAYPQVLTPQASPETRTFDVEEERKAAIVEFAVTPHATRGQKRKSSLQDFPLATGVSREHPSRRSTTLSSASDDDNHEVEASTMAPPPTKRTKQLRAHSKAEQRYRSKLSQRFQELKMCIPSLQVPADGASASNIGSDEDTLGLDAWINKATILVEAMKYIKQLEKRQLQPVRN